MPLSAGDVFAGYTIVSLLGAGGMGEVYLVDHPRLRRRDALKVLPARCSTDDAYRRRFEREADVAASLSHADIVTVYDRGEFDGQLWLSMDYVDGTDAAALRRTDHPTGMPRESVARIVTAIAAALDYAHGRGLLHRDVKPANILLAQFGTDQERILLADFGIARALDDTTRLTATNTMIGTPSYAAPEQLSGGEIDGRADQYALAASAYHLLAGVGPFDDPNPTVVIARHLGTPVPPISEHHRRLADLDAVFAKAMAKNPAQRYRSCREFAAALRAGGFAPATPAATPATSWPARGPLPQQPVSGPVPAQPFSGPLPALAFSGPLPAQSAPPAAVAARATPRPAQPAPPARRPPNVLISTLAGAGLLLLAVLVWAVLRLSGSNGPETATPATTSHRTTPDRATPATPATGVPAPAAPAPAVSSPPRMLLPDADQQGFLTGGARCNPGDSAVLAVRTQYSRAVICAAVSGSLYYRGARNSDGATLELVDVVHSGNVYTAINGTDATRYNLSRGGLIIMQNGAVISDEPAVEAAP